MAKKPISTMTTDDLRLETKYLRQQLRDIKKIQKLKERRQDLENKRKYHSFLDKIGDPVYIYDAITYKILHCNESFIKNYGYSKEEIFSMTPFDLYKPEEFEKLRKIIDSKTISPPPTFTHLTKDRRLRAVEIRTEGIYFDGNPAWMTLVHDLSERIMMEEELHKYRHRLEDMVDQKTVEVLLANKKLKQEIREREKAEQAILESEIKFRNIIEKSLDGIMLVDEMGSIIEWNKGQENIYGIKRAMVVGKKIWDVQFQYEPREKRVDENYKKLNSLWEDFFKTGNNPFQNNLQVSKIEISDGKLKDIQQLYFSIETDKGLMMASTTRDITSELVMEKQFIQAQKMEAMGSLAGGIAHDFNNILGGIIGFTQLSVRKSDEKSPVYKYLQEILTASGRATELVKQILTFSRSERKEKEPLRMKLIVKEAINLLRSSFPAAIEIVSKTEDDKSFILADPIQIHQVIMNLCTNAAHAMKDKGGVLEVIVTQETIEAGLHKELKSGPHLKLSVRDTGHGIKPEELEKIFEPFYTTKNLGEGTGMGLAVVHGIVKSHNAEIFVESKVDEGTTFSILFPIIVNVIQKEEKHDDTIPVGDERILLVEDDVPLAEAVKKLLEDLGYKVTMMSNGVKAFEIFQAMPDQFDIVITDYSMPKMTGIELTQKIRNINPDIPIILCSGFSKVITQSKAASLGIGDVIMKPIELGYVAKSIRKLIEKK